MASQPSDRLREMVAAARARALATAAPAGAAPQETRRVEALLDRAGDLPDPRALARMYRDRNLVERLPADEDEPPAAAVYSPPAAPTPGVASGPARAPLSPAQVREVMDQLREQFAAQEYTTYAPRPVPAEVIPPTDEEPGEPAETRDVFYVLGTIVAIVVIGVFVFLALRGPLRYTPPASGSPAPAVSARP